MNKILTPTRRLSYAPGEHLLSAWLRYNLRAGFAYISFDQSLKYWNLPKQHLKPQRINDNVQRTVIELTTTDKENFRTVILTHTVANLWRLSLPDLYVIEESSNPRANLENNAFAFTTGWQFCKYCVHEDRKQHGYSYWHRNHQLPSVTHCVIHKCSLTTSDELHHLSKLNLPSMLDGQQYTVADDHMDLIDWTNFVLIVDSLIAKSPDLIEHWKEQITEVLYVNEKAAYRRKEIYKGWQAQFENYVGSTILKHLFKSYQEGHTRKVNILWATLSGDSKANEIRHPVYWLVIMYWQRKQLLHLDDVDYACL